MGMSGGGPYRLSVSRQRVKGPRFTRLTSIMAPKTPVSTWGTSREGDEVLVEPLGLIGRGGVGEGGAVALPAVGEERELADHEHLASHVGQAQVGLAALVLEHAHLADLLPEPLCLGLAVAMSHAQKD